MKPRKQLFTYAAATIFAVVPSVPVQAADARSEIVPLIVIDEVPLSDSIKNLARQAAMNCILDPCVPGSECGLGTISL